MFFKVGVSSSSVISDPKRTSCSRLCLAMDITSRILSQEQLDRCKCIIAVHARHILYGSILTAVLVWLLVTRSRKRKDSRMNRSSPSDPEKPPVRQATLFKAPLRPLGEWVPLQFKRPRAVPLHDWDVYITEPLPYRPFKHGPYHITMGLRTMQWDEWIELDNHFLRFHADKAKRIEERGDKCCRTAPEAFEAALELLEEL